MTMTKTTTLRALGRTLALAGTLGTLAACRPDPSLETQTFRVNTLQPHEVAELIAPYVDGNREGAPGAVSVIDGALTVRETADNLSRIERVLAEFDRPRPDMRLHFQLIEADGFTDSDPRIADVEDQLRQLFQFRGYRLAGEATVTATDRAEIVQALRASDGMYEIQSNVYRIGGGQTRLEGVRLVSENGFHLETSVNIRAGQTIVLGSAPKEGSSATLFLTVRAEQGDAAPDDGGAA
jgi:hypothetical protein